MTHQAAVVMGYQGFNTGHLCDDKADILRILTQYIVPVMGMGKLWYGPFSILLIKLKFQWAILFKLYNYFSCQ